MSYKDLEIWMQGMCTLIFFPQILQNYKMFPDIYLSFGVHAVFNNFSAICEEKEVCREKLCLRCQSAAANEISCILTIMSCQLFVPSSNL